MLAGLIRDDERTVLAGVPGLSRPPAHRPPVREQPEGIAADRHHPDADAAHRPRARSDGSGPAAVPAGPERRQRRRHAGRTPRHPAAAARPGRRPARRDPGQVPRSRSRCAAGLALPQAAAEEARRRRRVITRVQGISTGHGDRRSPVRNHAGREQGGSLCRVRPRARPAHRVSSGVRRARRSRARRSRAGRPGSPLPPRAPRRSAPSPTACRGCRGAGPCSFVGPLTMIRCGSQRKRSARIALNCSSANSRSSYIQSCTSVSPSACVASTVTRLTMSLGKPGHSPVVMRRVAVSRRRLHDEAVVVVRATQAHLLERRSDDLEVRPARAGHLDLAAR